MEGGLTLVLRVRIAQHGVGPVPGVGDRRLRGVRQIAGRAGGDQIVLAPADKMGRGLAHIRRAGTGKMGAVIAGHVGVVLGEVGTDGLAVHPLEVVVGLAVLGHRQVEIPGAHAQGPQALAHLGVGAKQIVRGEHRLALGLILVHDLQPADEFLCALVIDDMGPVHAGAGVKRGIGILRLGRDDDSLVLPVIEVRGAVAAHAPVPDPVFAVGFFLVLAVPVIYAVQDHQAAAMGLDPLAVRVQPDPAGIKRVIAHG